ncbi:MAG TPA: D-alanine--D-alanine ligase [Candidatus Onthousia faecavium]|nr:D-alanine--D-alanine ligase [Candidatus Onthousia faecavium]
MKIKLGVIFGGETVEHEVSIISAIQAINKIDQEKYEVVPIYITKDREWYTGAMLTDVEVYQDLDLIKKYATNVVLYCKNGSFVLQSKGLFKKIITDLDVVFPIVHGTNVEDGVLQGYLQTIGIPYVGSNVYASVVGQDKAYMRDIFKANDINCPNYIWFYDSDFKNNQEEIIKKIEKIGYPVIVKPATTGSSIGIGVAKDKDKLKEAIEEAINYDSKIVVEEMIPNLMEVNIAVLGNYEHQETSVIEEVLSKSSFLTYEEKYIGSSKVKGKLGAKMSAVKGSKGMASADRKIPADISDKMTKEVEELAVRVFKALGSSGNARIDMLIDTKAKKVYVNEINSIPGSLAFYLWDPKGKDYTELLDDMINIAIKDYKRRESKTHSFKTNILQGFAKNGLKGMKGKVQK